MTMTAIRRRIRAVTLAWLLCQVASLSAFVPEQCCVSHAAAAAAKAEAAACHEEAPPAPQEGDACPMHHNSKSHDCCKISNTCEGPGTHLTTLFAYVGVLESPASSSVTLGSTLITLPSTAPLLFRLATPDAPPPKN
jgi:hypothetical protein